MPGQDIKSVLDTKPVTFNLVTGGGKWKCTLHGNRQSLDKHRVANPAVVRNDSGLSATSTASDSSAGSVYSH